MAYKGIDVSAHNGTINWTKVKSAGIAFVMLRMGYGTTTNKKFIETPFHSNQNEERRHPIWL